LRLCLSNEPNDLHDLFGKLSELETNHIHDYTLLLNNIESKTLRVCWTLL